MQNCSIPMHKSRSKIEIELLQIESNESKIMKICFIESKFS